MYRSCTWLCPLCVPSGESTREPGLLAHLNLSRRRTPGKSSTASAVQTSEVQTLTRGEPQSGASQKIDAEHFAGSTTANAKSSSTSTHPRAQHSWQNTWVTSKRMIHSSSGKESGFSRVFPRKRRRFSARDRYVKIVHALRNNTLYAQDVITRRPRFWSQNGPLDRVTLSWYSNDP
jgi:hypothetical protein